MNNGTKQNVKLFRGKHKCQIFCDVEVLFVIIAKEDPVHKKHVRSNKDASEGRDRKLQREISQNCLQVSCRVYAVREPNLHYFQWCDAYSTQFPRFKKNAKCLMEGPRTDRRTDGQTLI